MKLRSLVLVVVLALSCACRGGAPELRAAATYEPRWEAAPCRAAYPPAIAARCGFVAVPENRARPWTADNTVRLATVVFSSPGVRYLASPTLLLGGGPGGGVVALFDTLIAQYDGLQRHGLAAEQYPGHRQDAEQFRQVMDLLVADLGKRQLVVFDQRGSGRSLPALRCGRESWGECRHRLEREGVDVAAYNSIENAADVNDIRRVLRVERVNLSGGSYGTRLALEVMRRYPDIVRAAVLDGVAPPHLEWAAEVTRHYGAALQVLFDHCAADTACARTFSRLDGTFYALVARLAAHPSTVTVRGEAVRFDGDALRSLVWNGLYDMRQIRFLPLLIGSLARGDPSVLEAMLDAAPRSGDDIAWGMHYAVECPERVAYSSPASVRRAAANLHPAIREGVIREFTAPFAICADWDLPRADASVHEPVASDLPTLLLSGEFDSGTLPVFAELAARTLSRHYLYVLPYEGHTDMFTSRCHAAIASAFLDDPAHAPDVRCIAAQDRSPFVLH